MQQLARVTYDNGDQSDYLDLTFRCAWVSGEPVPVDGEMRDLAWHPVDALTDISDDMRARIEAAVATVSAARFEGGR